MPEAPASPSSLLDRALARDPARPLVTYYDDATGERVELSVATFANWVAKTANLLVDGLGVAEEARVALLLPAHWQNAVWQASCWAAGVTPCLAGDPAALAAGADVAVCAPATLDAALAADEVLALSLRPLGAPFGEPLPPGVLDYAREVATYGDRFAARSGSVAEIEGASWTAAAVLDEAARLAAAWGLEDGGRLLTTLDADTTAGALALLVVPLVVGGSVVIARGYEDGDVGSRLAAENVTALARRRPYPD